MYFNANTNTNVFQCKYKYKCISIQIQIYLNTNTNTSTSISTNINTNTNGNTNDLVKCPKTGHNIISPLVFVSFKTSCHVGSHIFTVSWLCKSDSGHSLACSSQTSFSLSSNPHPRNIFNIVKILCV